MRSSVPSSSIAPRSAIGARSGGVATRSSSAISPRTASGSVESASFGIAIRPVGFTMPSGRNQLLPAVERERVGRERELGARRGAQRAARDEIRELELETLDRERAALARGDPAAQRGGRAGGLVEVGAVDDARGARVDRERTRGARAEPIELGLERERPVHLERAALHVLDLARDRDRLDPLPRSSR